MKYIRIGNDIHIEWIILRNMQPESFTNKEVTVKLYDKNGLPQNFEFTKNGSSIVGTFYGKDQSTTGNYRLELVENAGKSNMVTLDYIDCFILSAKLKNTTSSGNDSSYGIKTDVVNLASNINLGGSTTSTPTDVDLSSYAKISYVDAKLALKANLSDIPKPVDTSNFALKTDIPNMSEYAKKSEIPSMDNVATKDELPNMDNVATKDELFSGDYNDLENKPTIPDTSNFALKSELPDMSNVATKDEIPVIPEFKTINGNSIVGTGNITIEGGGQAYDDTEVKNRLTALESKPDNDTIYDDSALVGRIEALEQKEDADTIYDDTEIRNLIAGKQDAGDYALKSELPDMSNVATKGELFSGDYNDLANKPTIPDTSNFALKSEIPSMENVATKDEIPVIPEFKTINGNSIIGTGNITIEGGGQAYDDTEVKNRLTALESKPDNDTIYDDTEIRGLIAGKQDSGDYALKSELPNLDDYALKSEIPTSTGLNEAEVNALIDAKLGEVETKLSEI